MGHDIDIIDETNIRDFVPKYKYKNIVLYLHENWTFPITNYIIDNFGKESFLIQHDDTDNEQLQRWSNRKPDLFMQREYTNNTILNSYGGTIDSIGPRIEMDKTPIEPFHFPINSMYDKSLQEKKWDVCFMGRPTNTRRESFINKLFELSKGSLKHLKWYIMYEYKQTPETFREVINGSKIGLNSPGNSYDSWRNWELASVGSCIIQPKIKVKSCEPEYMPFNDYIVINDDYSDLEEKIIYAIENDRWRDYGERAMKDYNNNHCPHKCFQYYYERVMKYANK